MKFWHLMVGIILIKKKKLQSTRFHWAGLILIHNHQATAMLCLIFCMVLTRYQNAKKEHPSGKYAPQKRRKASCACRLRLHTFRCRILSKPAWIKLLSAPEKMKGFTMSSSTPVCLHRNNPKFLHATCGYPMLVLSKWLGVGPNLSQKNTIRTSNR